MFEKRFESMHKRPVSVLKIVRKPGAELHRVEKAPDGRLKHLEA